MLDVDDKYCIYCHLLVKRMRPSRNPLEVGADVKQEPIYLHASLRDSAGNVSCGRRELMETEVEYLTDASEA